MLDVEMRVDSLLLTELTERTDVAFRAGCSTSVCAKVPSLVESDRVDLTTAKLIFQDNGRIAFHYTGTAEVPLEQLDANDPRKGDKTAVQKVTLPTHENNTIANNTTNATLTSLGAAFFKEWRMV